MVLIKDAEYSEEEPQGERQREERVSNAGEIGPHPLIVTIFEKCIE